MFYKNEKNLILIIRYTPLLAIIIFSIFITYFMEKTSQNQFNHEIKRTTELYTHLNNQKLKEEITKLYHYIKREDADSKKNLKKKIKMRVYEAHAIASKIYEDNKNHKTKKEIFALIKSALGSIIYNNGRGYFFMDDINGVNLLQPLNKKIENKNLSQLEDVNGYKFKQTIMQTIKDKTERFDTYYWYKNSKDLKAYKKISFYKYFEPFNIVIGTGEYIDDFERELKNDVISYIQKFNLNNDNYIFMFNFEGIMLAHKNEKLLGLDFLNNRGEQSRKQITKFIEIGKAEAQFLSYFNPSVKKAEYKKTSFVKGYEKWKWVFGTGYNNGKLLNIIAKAKKDLKIKNEQEFKQILYTSIAITLVLLLVSIMLSKYLENIFSKYRKRIQEEEKGFRNLFEYSNIGLAICDEDGKFLNVNSKFMQMLGYSNNQELLDKSWHTISRDNTTDNEDKNFSDLVNQKINTYSIEKLYIKEDGTKIDTFITANLLKQNDKVKNILFSIIDVTELKTKDKVLFQQSKLASMGEMIANIAHQWRQPLSIITTSASGLKLEAELDIEISKEQIKEYSNLVVQQAQYLSNTIDNFRDFLKADKNHKVIKIDKILDYTLALTDATIKNNNIKLIKKVEDNLFINGGINELSEAFINILNNSKDILKEKVINEEERFIFIHAYKKNSSQVAITFKDNGGGIPDDIIDRVFEPYFTSKHQSIGTGLGLAMADKIIRERHQGNISVSNESFEYEGKTYKGACFLIVLNLISK